MSSSFVYIDKEDDEPLQARSKESMRPSPPQERSKKANRRPLQELSRADLDARAYVEFTTTAAPNATDDRASRKRPQSATGPLSSALGLNNAKQGQKALRTMR